MSGYISAAGAAAKLKAESAGYVVGPEWSYGMMALRRPGEAEPHIWLDVGDTVRFSGDETDIGALLLLEVIDFFEGPEVVRRVRAAWNMPPLDDKPWPSVSCSERCATDE